MTNGFAVYQLDIDQAGEYYLWGRCYWPHVCANSFYLSIDDGNFQEIGENPIINQWHWIICSSYILKKGKHKLCLWNREVDSKIDKYLLTADPYLVPSGEGSSNNYYLDFNYDNNFQLLSFKNKEKWIIINEKETDNSILLLSKVEDNNNEMFLFPIDGRSSYVYRFAYKVLSKRQNNLKAYFNYLDESNNYYINLSDKETEGIAKIYPVTFA